MPNRKIRALLLIGAGVFGAGLVVQGLLGPLRPVPDDSGRVLRHLLIYGVAIVALIVEYLIANWIFRRLYPGQSLYDWIRKAFTS